MKKRHMLSLAILIGPTVGVQAMETDPANTEDTRDITCQLSTPKKLELAKQVGKSHKCRSVGQRINVYFAAQELHVDDPVDKPDEKRTFKMQECWKTLTQTVDRNQAAQAVGYLTGSEHEEENDEDVLVALRHKMLRRTKQTRQQDKQLLTLQSNIKIHKLENKALTQSIEKTAAILAGLKKQQKAEKRTLYKLNKQADTTKHAQAITQKDTAKIKKFFDDKVAEARETIVNITSTLDELKNTLKEKEAAGIDASIAEAKARVNAQEAELKDAILYLEHVQIEQALAKGEYSRLTYAISGYRK